MKTNTNSVCAAIALLAMVASVRADYTATPFEISPVVAPAPATPPYTSIVQSTTAGVTDGTYSMRVDAVRSGGFSWFYTSIGTNHNYNTTTYLN